MKSAVKVPAKVTMRIGRIKYVNCLPFYHSLIPEESKASLPAPLEFDFYESYPTRINLALRKGKIDLAPISSLEYLNHQKNYLLLPGLAIGCRDFSGSVLLFSKEKIEGLNGAAIAVSRQSLSSAILLRILLKFKYHFKNEFISSNRPVDEALKTHPAVLLIGDEALFYRPLDFVYKYDLSELWWNWTGKPFCFALWAVRRPFATSHPEEVRTFYYQLRRNLERNLADLEGLLRESMDLTLWDDNFPRLFGYLFNLSYGLDEAMQEGLKLFYRLAHRLGFSPSLKKLDFFQLPQPV